MRVLCVFAPLEIHMSICFRVLIKLGVNESLLIVVVALFGASVSPVSR